MKTIIHGVLFLLLVVASPAWSRDLTVDDFAAIRKVSDPQVSPDGSLIAYVVKTTGLKQDKNFTDIYTVPFAGGESIQWTSDEFDSAHPKSGPRWSPDNKYLSHLANRDGKTQLFLLNRSGGAAVQVTDLKQSISSFEWSPDGRKLAMVITDADPDETEGKKDQKKPPKPIVVTRVQIKTDSSGYLNEQHDHIYVFDMATKDLKQITSGPWDDASPKWSPDGSRIVFSSNRSEDPDINLNTDLFLIPAAGGELQKLTTNIGSDQSPDWSPDGKWIAYLTTLHPEVVYYDTSILAVIPAGGGEPRLLTRELDRNVFQPRFGPDSRKIYFLLEDRGAQRLASAPVQGGAINPMESTEKVVQDYDLNAKGLAYTASRPNLPFEVFASAPKQSSQLQITRENDALLKQLRTGSVEPIEFRSKDGTPVSGFVVKPPDFNPASRYPLINWIHGGPTSQYTDEWDFTPQLFAANGYVVTLINYRGSTGYGGAFCRAIFADWGNKEYEDLMAGVEYVVSLGYVDENRMAVGGWSYGGILTDWTILKTSRFKAAISGAGQGNPFAGYGTDHYQNVYEMELGFPWEHLDNWIKVSQPFLKLNQIKTPTLFLCGDQDWNVPLINSEQMYQGVRRLGIDTMLIIYPGEHHSINTPSFVKDRYRRYLAWFGHYVKGEKDKVPPPEPAKD